MGSPGRDTSTTWRLSSLCEVRLDCTQSPQISKWGALPVEIAGKLQISLQTLRMRGHRFSRTVSVSAGYWGAGESPRTSSDIAIRKWRSGNAPGRCALASAIEHAGEDHSFQE